jgi:hypothetical protein
MPGRSQVLGAVFMPCVRCDAFRLASRAGAGEGSQRVERGRRSAIECYLEFRSPDGDPSTPLWWRNRNQVLPAAVST